MASELSAKIIKQVEYYFSDINFSKDNFLKDQSGKDNGWIPINTLLTFNRLRSLTQKESDVADAFTGVKSEIVELNEANDKIRRINPLPEINEEYKLKYKLRAVHLKGFPREGTTLDDLIEYCSQYGELDTVQMRRFDDKTFKGCCFAVYKDVESANKAISSNDKFKGEHDLNLRENKETYFARKQARKNKRKSVHDIKVDENGEKNVDETGVEVKTEKTIEEEIKYETGCVLKLIDLPETINFRDIKPKFAEFGSVQYVDMFPETRSAIIRLKSSEDRKKVVEALANQNGDSKQSQNADSQASSNAEDDAIKSERKDLDEIEKDESNANKLKLKDDLIVSFSVLDGEEEREYWTKVKKILSSNGNNNKKSYQRGGSYKKKRFGGNRKFNNDNKRSANDDRDGNKRVKTEAV